MNFNIMELLELELLIKDRLEYLAEWPMEEQERPHVKSERALLIVMKERVSIAINFSNNC